MKLSEEFLFIYHKQHFSVHKFGGTITGSINGLQRIAEITSNSKDIPVLVVSAATGITDYLGTFLNAKINEEKIDEFIQSLREKHLGLIKQEFSANKAFNDDLERLRRILVGICYTEELSTTLIDKVLSFGERLISHIIRHVINAYLVEKDVVILYPDDFLVTIESKLQIAINLEKSQNIFEHLMNFPLSSNTVIIIPGFYGKTEQGKIILFGRSGTDYTASTLAYLLETQNLTIWKDVPGFMSGDPKLIPNAQRITNLSYNEASELSHFGAKILHHRAVVPAKLKKIPILVRNIANSDECTIIEENGAETVDIIKSITYKNGLGILKFYNTKGTADTYILVSIINMLGSHQIGIISIATSQTCVAFLVENHLDSKMINKFEKECHNVIDYVTFHPNVSLIACVGEKLSQTKGIAKKVFSALENVGVNVELISAGAATSALHFTVSTEYVKDAVISLHSALIEH